MSAPLPTDPSKATLSHAIAEIERRHNCGETKISEAVLADFPELCATRDIVLELIYLEYVLCQEAGRPLSPTELQARFPEYQADLQKILSVDCVFRNQAETPRPMDSTIGGKLRDSLDRDDHVDHADQRIHFDRLGDYELLEIIGHGGMGVVYRAQQRRLNRLVAVKTIDMLSSLNPAAVARFHSEAELVAKLQHPHIVQVYEVGSKLGVPFFSMELVAGGTLAQATQDRPLTPVTAAKIVETLARAVHYAHSQSVIHRDLKPANILLAPSDRAQAIEVPHKLHAGMLAGEPQSSRCEPKIADFGLAKFLEGAIDRTATQGIIGTPSYMAPEQIDPELGGVGPACDIYSLGAILYDAMTGTPPFNAATVIETIQQVQTAEVIPPSKLIAKIPRDLETICLKCLRKEPTKRYQTAGELADDLQRFLSGQPILARPAGLVERNWKWARRHPSLAAFFTAVVAASIGMTVLWLKSEHSRLGEQAALQRNDLLLYDRDIALAQFEYDSNRIGGSREILEKTRPEFRGWEWDYLRNQSAASVWESTVQLEPINQVAISSDGRYVAWVNRDISDDSELINVWDIVKNQLRWRLESDYPCDFTDVQFNRDGSMLLSSSTPRTTQQRENSATSEPRSSVALWDLHTGTLLRSFSPTYSSLARFSRDGSSIFVGMLKDTVEQYSIDSGEMHHRYRVREKLDSISTLFYVLNYATDLDFNPDGSQMVVATYGSGVTIWNIGTGKVIQQIEYRNKNVGSLGKVAWSPDGQTLSMSDMIGTQRLYRFSSGGFKLAEEHQHDTQSYCRFTPDGRRSVWVTFGQATEIRTLPSGKLEKSIAAHNGKTLAMAFDSSGRYMVTGGADNRVHVWDLSLDDPRYVDSSMSGFHVSAFDFNPTSSQIALAVSHHSLKKYRLEIRDLASHRLENELSGHTEPPTCIAYSGDGKLLLSGGVDRSVRLWDPLTGKLLSVLEGHEAPLAGVAFLREWPFATSIDEAGVLMVWNLNKHAMEQTYILNARVTSASFHPLQPIVAIACQDKGVEIWDVLQGKQLADVPMTSDVTTVCFSQDGLRLATVGNEPATLVWSTAELLLGKHAIPEVKLEGHTGNISSVSFSPDGKRLVSCSQDESVRLFDVIGGRELMRFDSFQGNDGLIRFSPDGKSIVRTLGGKLKTWRSDIANPSTLQEDTKVSMIAWHKSEAAAAEESHNWFAAHFHQSQLIQLDPQRMTHHRERANLNILLADFAGAERDLLHCQDNLEESDELEFLTDLARAYLGQQKWTEYRDVCQRLLQQYGNSTTPAELNTCLWLCALSEQSKLDTSAVATKLEELILNPRYSLITYLNALALCHYRNEEYQQAINVAQESANKTSLSKTRLPVESMIIALSYARLDQQRLGWLPRFIRQKIRQWGLSTTWNSSLHFRASTNSWLLENEEVLDKREVNKRQDIMIFSVDLPHLLREWEEIANAR